MNASKIIGSVLFVLAGLGVFLYGTHVLSENLETASGQKLRKLFNKISNNKFVGVAIGAGVTGIIQSSTATTVIVVGFVNAGIMTLFQATAIIMGANIGTTITAQIVALSAFSITPFLCALAFVGIVLLMFKKPIVKNIGTIFISIGIIFIGLELMGSTLKVLKDVPQIADAFTRVKSPLLLLLLGILFTFIIQSSSATTSLLIQLSAAGLINLNQAIFVAIGANIGTCFTAIIAAIGTNTNAKRASLLHVTFNILGAVIFVPIMAFTPLANYFQRLFPHVQTQIAMFHTFFNILTTFCLIWFIKLLCKYAEFVIKDKPPKNFTEKEMLQERIKNISLRMFESPTIAIEQVHNEIIAMHQLARQNLEIAKDSIVDCNLDKKEEFIKREKEINLINRELSKLFVKFSDVELSEHDRLIMGTYFHVISDIERIGDYAENIIEFTQKLIDENMFFSDDAKDDINSMYNHVITLDDLVLLSFKEQTRKYLRQIDAEENSVDLHKLQLEEKHIERIKANICVPANGITFISLITTLERIADHMVNISYSLKDYVKENN